MSSGLIVFAMFGCTTSSSTPSLSEPSWQPGTVYPSEGPVERGFVDVRGLVHAHSVYSHDACDGIPVLADGGYDPVCFDDFRRGLCQSGHDFVFLTDHGDRFQDNEFPDVLLFRPDLGDELLDRGDGPVANRVTCDDGHTALILAGTENGLMPVGLEKHVADDRTSRASLYGPLTDDAAQALRDAGAIVLLAHPEDYSVDQLREMPVDGFEMFNLHANTELNAGIVVDLLFRANNEPAGLPNSDLLVLAIQSEDPRYLERWGRVLATGKRLSSTMGTDCHRNALQTIMPDGERADSYRRLMIAFSNHLRVVAADRGVVDDRALKEALRRGRLWGAFEVMGYPIGFDAHAERDGVTYEFGDEVPSGARLSVRAPRVRGLDKAAAPPRVTLRVLRAVDDVAGFVEVVSTEASELDYVFQEPGAYRVEVRMMPWHLRDSLIDDASRILDEADRAGVDYPWIYANPFYVR